jgi:hypothetical protein
MLQWEAFRHERASSTRWAQFTSSSKKKKNKNKNKHKKSINNKRQITRSISRLSPNLLQKADYTLTWIDRERPKRSIVQGPN